MNRDNALFALLGVLIGFIGAYTVLETVGAKQPALRIPGQATAGAPAQGGPAGGPSAQGAPGGNAAPAQGQPAMEQVQRLRQYVEDNPEDANAVGSLANLNLQIGNVGRALELFDRYLGLRPEDADTTLRVAHLHFDTGNLERARDLYESYLKARPGDPAVLTDLGVTYRELGDPQAALTAYREATAISEDAWMARYNEVLVLGFDLADLDAAEEALEKLRQSQPNNPDVQRLAAELEKRRTGG